MSGMSQEFDPTAWRDAGFTTEEAGAWQRWQIPLAAATDWRNASVSDPAQAAQWSIAGVGPDTVHKWLAAGIEPTEAVRWQQMGFDWDAIQSLKHQGLTPETAFERRSGSALSSLMEGVLRIQWADDETAVWERQQIPTSDVKLWQLIGLTPREAGRFVRQGQRPENLIREWWRAGIPYDEVASWLAAGLSAKEAAAQRAQGVTAEQAAALRALRRDDGDD